MNKDDKICIVDTPESLFELNQPPLIGADIDPVHGKKEGTTSDPKEEDKATWVSARTPEVVTNFFLEVLVTYIKCIIMVQGYEEEI